MKYGGDECDLIFDEYGPLGPRVVRYWETIKNVPPDAPDAKERGELLAKTSMPIFKNDRKCLPLQAADLWAWIVDEFYQSPNDHLLYDAFRKTIIEIPTISRNWDDKSLIAMGAQLMIQRARKLGFIR